MARKRWPLTTNPRSNSTVGRSTSSSGLPEEIHTEVVNAYAQAMAPTSLYLVPTAALRFVISLFLRDRRLSTKAGLVARGEATGISTVQEPSSDQTAPAER